MNHIARSHVDKRRFSAGGICGRSDLQGSISRDGDGGANELLIGSQDHANLPAEGGATVLVGLQQT